MFVFCILLSFRQSLCFITDLVLRFGTDTIDTLMNE